jgi:hypothetical protein
MRNLTFPKECASKLVLKFVEPYKVLSALSGTSNYKLELPTEFTKWCVHNHFHVNLLKPHVASNDALFPNKTYSDPYDFGAPDNAKWYVEEITAHCWKGHKIEFLVKWNLGDSTWEPLANCNKLAALDAYLALMDAKDWNELPKHMDKPIHGHQRT